MSTEDNKALVRRYLVELVTKRNPDIVDELVAKNGGGTCGGSMGRVLGRDVFRANAEQVLAAFPDLELTIEEMVAEGDAVAIRWTARGTHGGPLMGIPATGRYVTITNIELHHIADGQIRYIFAMPDTMSLLQQLNVLPQPGEALRGFFE